MSWHGKALSDTPGVRHDFATTASSPFAKLDETTAERYLLEKLYEKSQQYYYMVLAENTSWRIPIHSYVCHKLKMHHWKK